MTRRGGDENRDGDGAADVKPIAHLYKTQVYQLAELLTEWDERVGVWRFRHFKVVARIIGEDVVGTQGTPVEVLGRLIHKNMYPDLWTARNRLTALAEEDD